MKSYTRPCLSFFKAFSSLRAWEEFFCMHGLSMYFVFGAVSGDLSDTMRKTNAAFLHRQDGLALSNRCRTRPITKTSLVLGASMVCSYMVM